MPKNDPSVDLSVLTLKILKGIPERFKRERIYETMEALDSAVCQRLREEMGDTSGDRDTKDSIDV